MGLEVRDSAGVKLPASIIIVGDYLPEDVEPMLLGALPILVGIVMSE